MSNGEALAKLISVRHHCFVRGVLGREDCYRSAFRTLNRLYVELKGQTLRQDAQFGQSQPRRSNGNVGVGL